MPLGVRRGQTVGLIDFCHILTYLAPGDFCHILTLLPSGGIRVSQTRLVDLVVAVAIIVSQTYLSVCVLILSQPNFRGNRPKLGISSK